VRASFWDAVVDLVAVHAKGAVIVKNETPEAKKAAHGNWGCGEDACTRVHKGFDLVRWRVEAVDRPNNILKRGNQAIWSKRHRIDSEIIVAGGCRHRAVDDLG